MWVLLSVVLCLGTLTFVHTQQLRIAKKPSVCDGAKRRYGMGYNPHPYDCTQYVQCFYLENSHKVIPVYRDCEYGWFWNQESTRCEPSDSVDCIHDKCRRSTVPYYKHSDPNKCSAYWECQNRKASGKCCPEGQGFHPRMGCIKMPSCKDMCPYEDRVPGSCRFRPVSGAPTKYERYGDNGDWIREDCTGLTAFSPADCSCSIELKRTPCRPDLKINFENGIRDISGNNYTVVARRVRLFGGAAYFRGNSRLVVERLRPITDDDGIFILKLSYREDLRRRRMWGHQAMVTNGHCGKDASVVVTKIPGKVFVGAESYNMTEYYSLPTVDKPWKEIIYMKDRYKLETRVCGATEGGWSVGPLKDTLCGLQFGNAPGMRGFFGLIKDIEVYRCKPLDAVINMDY